MMMRYPGKSGTRRGISLIEATIATIIVAGMLVASLNSVATSRTVRGRVADRTRGQELALDLMSEIMQQGFANPGIKAASRSSWGYVDDYNGLFDSPPTTKSGNAISDVSTWSRSVTIQWVDGTTLLPTTSINTGLRLITVNVTRGSLVLASLSAYRSSGWVSEIPSFTDASLNHAPTAAATGSPLSGNGGHLTVNFSGANSSDPDNDTLSYVWSFGDGKAGSGATISHNYTAAGTYTAALTVDDGRGGVGVSSVTVVVNP